MLGLLLKDVGKIAEKAGGKAEGNAVIVQSSQLQRLTKSMTEQSVLIVGTSRYALVLK